MKTRFDGIEKASMVLEQFLEIARQTKRSFIWDQTNLTREGRIKNVSRFRGQDQANSRGFDFKIIAQVFVSPDEVTSRQQCMM